MKKPIYANIGCGGRFREEWLNFDLHPAGPQVTRCDISAGIPLPQESCDLVYHSHVLEHLKQDQARRFLKECHRVLKPGGVLRVVVPDLEQICRLYLDRLEHCCRDEVAFRHDYQWLLLEMYDQTVREVSGGGMKAFLSGTIANEPFVASRIGEEYRELVSGLRQAVATPAHPSWKGRIKAAGRVVRDKLLTTLLGASGMQALEIGRFRQSGEVHQWMYDRVSLARELSVAGFTDLTVHVPTTSAIPDWGSIGLDALPDATAVKPDSLYMEGRKPTSRAADEGCAVFSMGGNNAA